jgi:hypothetical protein
MSHFAKLENGIVTQVIVAEQDFINSGVVGDSFLWVQTSYNNNFRGKFASVGDTYTNDKFIAPQPHPSWALDDSDIWQPPTSKPAGENMFTWDEDTTSWVETTGET